MKCIHYYVGLGNLQLEIVAHIAAGGVEAQSKTNATASTEIEGMCAPGLRNT